MEQGAAIEQVLVETLGFLPLGESESTRRFSTRNGEAGTSVDVRTTGGFVQGVSGAGTVHHVAWSVPDDAVQLAFRHRLPSSGLSPRLSIGTISTRFTSASLVGFCMSLLRSRRGSPSMSRWSGSVSA